MENVMLPSPEQIDERIADCELELKSLRRLRRMSQAARDAAQARRRRACSTHAVPLPEQQGAARVS
jgi:hypothetical protein